MEAKIQVQDLSDESITVVKWEPLKSVSLMIFLALLLIIGMTSRVLIINFIHKMTSNRPINLNILVDQALELPTFIIFNSMILISMAKAEPIERIFGPIGSMLLWISILIHNSSLSIGGFGIALYRLLCILDLGLCMNMERSRKFMNRIMILELVILAVLDSMAVIGGLISNSAMSMEVAKGYTATMEHIINQDIDEDDKTLGKRLLSLSLLFASVFMLIEMACYIIIYVQLYRNDEKMKTSLSKNIVSYRRKRNAITLSTQAIGLGIEIVCTIFGSLIISFQVADASIFFITVSISSAATNLMHVLGSAEMRQYYNIME